MVEQRLWNEARQELSGRGLPADPSTLGRESLGEVASDLHASGWSYGEIAQATGVPKTTVYRWVSGGDEAPSSGTGGLLGVLASVGIGALILWAAMRGHMPPGLESPKPEAPP